MNQRATFNIQMQRPFEEIVDELIFQPLKLHNSTLTITISGEKSENFSCGHYKSGDLVDGKHTIYPYPAASGLWTTPSDLSHLVTELLNSLKGKSKIGLSASKGRELEISSLGWGVGFQCMMVAYPYLETGLVIMTNTDLGVHQLKGIIGEVYHSLTF
jgi:CubicO group peptidase (beta-lactamase class C family)